MSTLFAQYNPRTVFIPATLLSVIVMVGTTVYLIHQNSIFSSGPYTGLLAGSGIALALSAFFIAYSALFLQMDKYKSIGYVFSVLLFGLALYYLYSGLLDLSINLSIDQTLFDYLYASVAMLFLIALSEFGRLFRINLFLSIALLLFGLVTNRTFLTQDFTREMTFLNTFLDLRFWNVIGIFVAVMSGVMLFLSSNLLFEKMKKTSPAKA